MLGALLTLFAGTMASANAGDLTYRMYNNTNQPIVRIWASPTTSPNWEESTNAYVPVGGNQNQTFESPAYGSDCYYDIKIQFQEGSSFAINHVDLCSISAISLDVRNGALVYFTN